jgi:Mg2+-importing ATPase
MTKPVPSVQGLTSREAETRLAELGLNEPSPSRNRSALVQFLALFLNPLVLILLIASAVSGLLGNGLDAFIIVVVLAVGIAINFSQTYRSSRAAERLREQVSPTAMVLRDGRWNQIPRRLVVPGGLIRLSAGDMVPAMRV